jgi:uncharacterized protein YndB with AHSA1/START domain
MKKIKIETLVEADIYTVWRFWNEPQHIKGWAFASYDWECPHAENDLKVSGKFLTRMSAKDKTVSFDIVGTYTAVVPHEKIEYIMEDGRTVSVQFESMGEKLTKVIEEFEMENQNSEEMQRAGWQSILENFKKYTKKTK